MRRSKSIHQLPKRSGERDAEFSPELAATSSSLPPNLPQTSKGLAPPTAKYRSSSQPPR
jgi:hypothetical protein